MNSNPLKWPLHIQIILGLLLGVVWAFISLALNISSSFSTLYIQPLGNIFLNMLKMVAIPLVITSLVVGISSLDDMTKLSKMGFKTISIYITTTILATIIGLFVANVINPGSTIKQDFKDNMLQEYGGEVALKISKKNKNEESFLTTIEHMVPENLADAFTDNTNMLQIVFFAFLMGIALVQIQKDKAQPIVDFFGGFNEVMIKIIDYTMRIAPIGVFAIIGSMLVKTAGDDPNKALDLLLALGWYSISVIIGLLVMIVVVYPTILKLMGKSNPWEFFQHIKPVQLLAFSTSSSLATLPLTMETCEKKLGVSEEVAGFVLPIGATINMDGTVLYQVVATVFIASVYGINLSLGEQLTIVLTATMASIGTAGTPGAGIIMLVIVLTSVGIPAEGIALITAPDRILDMFRTVVNVTGDCTVAKTVDASN